MHFSGTTYQPSGDTPGPKPFRGSWLHAAHTASQPSATAFCSFMYRTVSQLQGRYPELEHCRGGVACSSVHGTAPGPQPDTCPYVPRPAVARTQHALAPLLHRSRPNTPRTAWAPPASRSALSQRWKCHSSLTPTPALQHAVRVHLLTAAHITFSLQSFSFTCSTRLPPTCRKSPHAISYLTHYMSIHARPTPGCRRPAVCALAAGGAALGGAARAGEPDAGGAVPGAGAAEGGGGAAAAQPAGAPQGQEGAGALRGARGMGR